MSNHTASLTYVGLDVHADTITVAVAEGSSRARGRGVGTIPNRPDAIRKAMKKLGRAKSLRVCYEAGPTGYALYWQLHKMGLACEVIAPTLVPVRAGDRIKTDKRDALKLARAYRAGELTPIFVPDAEHQAFSKSAGQSCLAVTSHLDLAPTLLSWTGLSDEHWAAKTRELKGKKITPLLASPAKAKLDAIRPGSLYNYNMLLYVDAAFLRKIADYLQEGNDPKKLKQAGIVPDLGKRGAIRSVFDGRYKFSRYFSPRQHNTPTTLEELLKLNDLELFDTHKDVLESRNLAADARTHGELILAMNAKLNALMAGEVGEDNGGFLPGGADGSWAVSTFDP